jgi:hypothetical protein
MKLSLLFVVGAAGLLSSVSAVNAASLQAAYVFNGNLIAQEPGAPALTPTNPLGTNSFQNDTVFGGTHSTYAFNGVGTPVTSQAGLTFNDSANLVSPASYSLEMVFELSGNTGWRRLINAQNRQSDSGVYVNPSSNYALFPTKTGSAVFSPNVYTDLIMTNDGTNLAVYVNGTLDFVIADSQMNLNNANNPGQLVNLFLDNTVGGGQGEFSSGRIALFEAFDGVLSSTDASVLAANPFANVPGATSGVPEPGSWLLAAAGLVICGLRKRRKS